MSFWEPFGPQDQWFSLGVVPKKAPQIPGRQPNSFYASEFPTSDFWQVKISNPPKVVFKNLEIRFLQKSKSRIRQKWFLKISKSDFCKSRNLESDKSDLQKSRNRIFAKFKISNPTKVIYRIPEIGFLQKSKIRIRPKVISKNQNRISAKVKNLSIEECVNNANNCALDYLKSKNNNTD